MEEKNGTSETAGKPIRCRAAIARKAGEELVIEEIEVDPPKSWEVRIKVLCTSLCHTDVTFWKLAEGAATNFPRILGHEAVGVVESVGDDVNEVKEGDLVLPVFSRNCEECRECKSSKGNSCTIFSKEFYFGMPRDGTSRFKDCKGETLAHFLAVSSFTEYTVVDITHVVKISNEIPLNKALLFGCGVTTGIGATWKVAQVEKGSTVAIFGLGAVGLAVAEGARLGGASRIIGVDLNPEKYEIGKKFGVTDFVNPKSCVETPVTEVIKEMTGGGADYCFECVGLVSLMQDAINSSHPGWGKTVILGMAMPGTQLSVNPRDIWKGRSIVGSQFGGIKAKSDIPILTQKFIDKELNLDGFVTHEVKLKDINKAFDLLVQGQSIRCLIWMD